MAWMRQNSFEVRQAAACRLSSGPKGAAVDEVENQVAETLPGLAVGPHDPLMRHLRIRSAEEHGVSLVEIGLK